MTQLMSVEEWNAAFEEAVKKGTTGGGMTMREIAAATGMPETAVKTGLRRVYAAGRLVCRKEPRPCIDGAMRMVPVYAIAAKREG